MKTKSREESTYEEKQVSIGVYETREGCKIKPKCIMRRTYGEMIHGEVFDGEVNKLKSKGICVLKKERNDPYIQLQVYEFPLISTHTNNMISFLEKPGATSNGVNIPKSFDLAISDERQRKKKKRKEPKVNPSYFINERDNDLDYEEINDEILAKSRNSGHSVYEFPAKDVTLSEMIIFAKKVKERRNARYENNPKEIYNTVANNVKFKLIEPWL